MARETSMRPLHIYIETSVFGFLLDDTEVNRTKRENTEKMFQQIDEGLLTGYVSDLVFAELAATPHLPSREAMLERAHGLQILPGQNEVEVDYLVDRYMAQRVFPEDKRDDAAHVAIVVLNPNIDALVSWNCKHLANEHNRRRIKALTLGEGYGFKFDIITPEEVILYG